MKRCSLCGQKYEIQISDGGTQSILPAEAPTQRAKLRAALELVNNKIETGELFHTRQEGIDRLYDVDTMLIRRDWLQDLRDVLEG